MDLPTDQLDRAPLFEILSEFLAIERDGIRLYDRYLVGAPDEIRTTLADHRFEMDRHAALIAAAIERLGGDPAYRSPAADTAERRTDLLLSVATEQAGWLHRLETILILETKDAYIWDVLRLLVAESTDAAVVAALRPPTVNVTSQDGWDAPGTSHAQRIGWARDAMREVALNELGLRRQSRLAHLRNALPAFLRDD